MSIYTLLAIIFVVGCIFIYLLTRKQIQSSVDWDGEKKGLESIFDSTTSFATLCITCLLLFFFFTCYDSCVRGVNINENIVEPMEENNIIEPIKK